MTSPSGTAEPGVLRDGSWRGLGPVGARRLLNATSLVLVVATLAHWGEPDLVLDALWVSLAVGAFVFGLRMTVLRILIVASVVLTYSFVETRAFGGPELEPLELAEWPLMVLLTILIAVMADRVSNAARRYATLYRQASDRLITAHEDERAHLARDLHDRVGQTLTAVVLTLDVAESSLPAEPEAEPAQTALRRARGLAVAALDEARDVAAQLRPIRIHEVGLGAALRELAESAGIPVEVRFAPGMLPPGSLEPHAEIDAYRIVQEAIGNAARHSHAEHVWIDAEVRDDAMIRIEVGDDGVGFDKPTVPARMGLPGMQERAATLRGRLEIRSRPGAGTVVDLLMPRPTPLEGLPVPATAVHRGAIP